jgi:hypothetical protein
MGTFDPDGFMNSSVEQANEVNYTPIPEAEYTAILETVKAREIQTKNGPAQMLDCGWHILDEELRGKMDMEKIIVNQSLFLDFTPDGRLEFGLNKNVTLGRLREAFGQNTGKPWSPQDLVGSGPITIKVGQRPDKNDPSKIYNSVTGYAAA